MGRFSGLAGGFVLTTTLIYLTVRQHQDQTQLSSQALRETTQILDSILQPPAPPQPRTTFVQTRPDLLETMKDTWNSEIEGMIKWVQNSNPTRIFETLEEVARNAFAGLRQAEQATVKEGEK